MKIGNNIRKIREMRDMTQTILAEKLNMSQNGYCKIERDETDIPFSRLVQISEALEVPLFDLIDFDDKRLLMTNHTLREYAQGFVFNKGIPDSDRKLYEARISDLQKELDRLHILLEKALNK